MRIVHVVRQYAPGIGGLESYVAQLARFQQGMGHEVRVLTLDRVFNGDKQRLPAHDMIDGIPVERIEWRGSHRYPFAPSAVRRLGDADLVHIHGVDSFVDMLASTRWLHRKPMILSTHGGFFHTGFAQRLKRLFFATITRWSLSGMRAVLASSVQDYEAFARLWPDRTFLVENAVDVERFAGIAQPDARTMIYFGRIAPNKQVSRLLTWFAALHSADSRWQLIIAGKPMGVTLTSLATDAIRLGIGTLVEFYDTPDDATLKALIARSSSYVCASSYEGFGLAAVEAASAGLYPALSDIAPFRRTCERIGFGTLIDFTAPPDPESFLAGWRQFAADRPTTDAIAERVSVFAWPRVAARIEHIMATVMGHDTRRIGPLDISVMTREAALARVLDAVTARQPLLVAFANAHTVNSAKSCPALITALSGALLLNDGIGIEIASRALYGAPFPQNLNGTDFTPALLGALPAGTRLFLLGSAPGVAEEAGSRWQKLFPQIELVGTQHGFFTADEEPALIAQIAASGTDLVFVAMGNPRQEIWASDHLKRIGVPVLCVGALFDFTAGVMRRSPDWVQRAKMEWLYRLAQEPRRLSRRYIVGNATFLSGIAWQWVTGRRSDTDAAQA